MGQSPENFGYQRSCWTLKLLGQVIEAFSSYSRTGILRVLKRFGVRHLRARHYIHSPDKLYEEKLKYIQEVIGKYDPAKQELYFMDQLTVYLHPSVGYDWSKASDQQPLALQGYRSNTTFRICGAINAINGQTEQVMRNKISIFAIVQFFEQVVKQNPGKTIFIILDNWPQHWHPDVRAALQTQLYPFPHLYLPKSWQHLKPRKKYIGINLPVQLVYLPTYASWLNPIEKVWRRLKQEVIHNHRATDDFDTLKMRVTQWFNSQALQTNELRQYVGLKAPDGIFSNALKNALSNVSKNY